MPLIFANREIEIVRLIDDDPEVRSLYRDPVEELSLDATEVSEPITDVERLLHSFHKTREAAICDFQLTTKNYSSANGDELVSRLYSLNVPAVLCTRWAGHLPDPVRYRRRQIPVVLRPANLSPDTISSAFESCVNEFLGVFSNGRRPWRALIRIEGGEPVGGGCSRLNLVIPSWDSSIGLTYVVPSEATPALRSISEKVSRGEIVRAFGQVNLGVETEEDIYIDEWSLT